mmetsp:Transcript_18409/g.22627  ORF Transcript_18409/g.22627 Transcript_18409/m.22627 type:complete len:662 (-) Transcript_18409:192-2177(-)|eukprot:CAMPEP_0204839290 /NCGR_PEP_ID=MMETSP1346-20131115/33639_1 /ASSEMBLY_ACC=CAM_ASM_000771 /TAXON_ID=215587 /ORGANISM="Aplanochytrium stocchinoi, Strain GSBS06" /LENGTH=661 /DNA_ID=CAMNT_0051975895 /DNA_START=409 /DNA_END=2394 /DNA_ORIENTATION=+
MDGQAESVEENERERERERLESRKGQLVSLARPSKGNNQSSRRRKRKGKTYDYHDERNRKRRPSDEDGIEVAKRDKRDFTRRRKKNHGDKSIEFININEDEKSASRIPNDNTDHSKNKRKPKTQSEVKTMLYNLQKEDGVRNNIYAKRMHLHEIFEYASMEDENTNSGKGEERIKAASPLSKLMTEVHIRTIGGLLVKARECNAADEETLDDEQTRERILTLLEADVAVDRLRDRVIGEIRKENPEELENRGLLLERSIERFRLLNKDVMLDSIYCLAAVVDGDARHTTLIINEVFPVLLEILHGARDPMVIEAAMYMIGCTSHGISPENRGLLLNHQVARIIANKLDLKYKHIQLLRTGAWAISSLTAGGISLELFPLFVEAIHKLSGLIKFDDDELLVHSCWAISNLTFSGDSRIEVALEANIVPRIVELLLYRNPTVQWRSLRTVCSILSGTEDESRAVLELGALSHFKDLLGSGDNRIRRESCFALSNVVATADESVIREVFFTDTRTLSRLVDIARNDEKLIRYEATHVLALGIKGGNNEQRLKLVQAGSLEAMVDVLKLDDPPEEGLFILVCSCLYYLLNAGSDEKWTISEIIPTASPRSPETELELSRPFIQMQGNKNIIAYIMHKIGAWDIILKNKDKMQADHVLVTQLSKFL